MRSVIFLQLWTALW